MAVSSALALKKVSGAVTRESFLRAISSLSNYESGDFVISYGPNGRFGMKKADITLISSWEKLVR